MSQSRHAPHRLTAAVLALLVHGAFFAFLYLGVDWHAEQPQGMVVDIWDNLPVAQHLPPPAAEPEPAEPPPKPVVEKTPPQAVSKPVKAEIELKDKKQPREKPVKESPPVRDKTPPKKVVEPPRMTAAMKADQAARAEQERLQAERDRLNAAQEAAAGRVLDEYAAKIRSKIRHNVILPPDVADNARVEFDVTLLPGGMVLSARMTKSSGNSAYDSAVERAILKSQPLPLPPDATLFNRFRNLHLKFSPVE